MSLSKLLLPVILMMPAVSFASEERIGYKGFVCEERLGMHDGTHVTRIAFEVASNAGERPQYKLTYTPSYLEGKQTPNPELWGTTYGINWLPKEDHRVLESWEQDESGVFHILKTRFSEITEPGCCGDYLTVNKNFEIKVQTARLDQNRSAKLIPGKELSLEFHPSFCAEIK